MTSDSAFREEPPGTIMANHGLHLTVACAPASELRRSRIIPKIEYFEAEFFQDTDMNLEWFGNGIFDISGSKST
jgi:hypothetical protein